MGETLGDLPAVLVSSPFLARIFSIQWTVRMQKSGVTQGPEPHFFFGPMYAFVGSAGWVRLSAAQRNPSSIRLGPWPPRFPGPLKHHPLPSPSLVQVWRHFATFFLARWGVPAPKGQNKGFPRSGRIRGGMGPERCGSGAPNRPFEWPHSRFGRARYFFSDPPFGLWGLFENPIGQNLGQ